MYVSSVLTMHLNQLPRILKRSSEMKRLMLMLEVVGLSLPKPLILFFKFIDV